MRKYTLDQITDGQYVFLERPDEVNQLLIPEKEINGNLSEGDIVSIHEINEGYKIAVLKEDTKITRKKVSDLLEKLKNKNN